MTNKSLRQVENNIRNQLKDARSETNSTRVTHKIDTIEERLLVTEYMTQTICSLLEKNGITREQIMEELEKTMEARDKFKYQVYNKKCPRCNRKMQSSPVNPIKYRCMYCNAYSSVYPYLRYEEQPEPEFEEENNNTSPVAAEPYDLEKDLDFNNWN